MGVAIKREFDHNCMTKGGFTLKTVKVYPSLQALLREIGDPVIKIQSSISPPT